jgi:phenylacetate-coenzyme A ligase PaaK-like adenylate-forming protein
VFFPLRERLGVTPSHLQTTSKINVLPILTFVFLDKNWEDKRFCAEWNLNSYSLKSNLK